MISDSVTLPKVPAGTRGDVKHVPAYLLGLMQFTQRTTLHLKTCGHNVISTKTYTIAIQFPYSEMRQENCDMSECKYKKVMSSRPDQVLNTSQTVTLMEDSCSLSLATKQTICSPGQFKSSPAISCCQGISSKEHLIWKQATAWRKVWL